MNLILILLFGLLLAFPDASLKGAQNGLMLWFHTVLPTLLPFLFLSSLLVKTGVATRISRALRFAVCPLFLVGPGCGYAILMGLVSGYPLGAKTCADLVSEGSITKAEGQFLLCFCNNASPMFLISFVGGTLLGLQGAARYVPWLLILSSALLTGIIYRIFHRYTEKAATGQPQTRKTFPADATRSRAKPPGFSRATSNTHPVPLGSAVEDALESALHTITLVGGYIILFSLLGNLLSGLPGLPAIWSAFLTGILEITTGSDALMSAALLAFPATRYLKTALLAAILAFGGFSSVLQTKSVLGGSGLSILTYMKMKALHALLAAILSVLVI